METQEKFVKSFEAWSKKVAGGWLSHPETLQTAAARNPSFFPRDSKVTDGGTRQKKYANKNFILPWNVNGCKNKNFSKKNKISENDFLNLKMRAKNLNKQNWLF